MSHSVALTFEDQEMTVVDKAVNHGGSHLLIGEDPSSFRKFKIGCQNQTFTFITVGDNTK